MPTNMPSPPQKVVDELKALNTALDGKIPAKKKNLLIATWNICTFGGLTSNFNTEVSGSPKRNTRWLYFIADIVKRFDVVAIQEVRGNLRALRHLMGRLGPEWGFLLTDVTRGSKGNDERLAFLFDTTRVKPSGLACELVVPEDDSKYLSANSFQQQFVRTPYAASFVSGKQTFILVTLHVNYGKSSADRIRELKAIANWMSRWASSSKRFHHNLIVLGDFNIDRSGDKLYTAFTDKGLTVPESLEGLPRTIFYKKGKKDTYTFYDQIAWFSDSRHKAKLNMDYRTGGSFDFKEEFVRDVEKISNTSLKFRMSDHYPLWVEFGV